MVGKVNSKNSKLASRSIFRFSLSLCLLFRCHPFRMISDTGQVRLFSHSRDGRPDQLVLPNPIHQGI